MWRFSNPLKQPDEISQTFSATQSEFLIKTNEAFKFFFNNCNWFVYTLAACVILCCIYYYICDCKRHLSLRRRRAELQRENARPPHRRRPGAIYREHEIFRSVLNRVHQYAGVNKLQAGAKDKLE